MLGCLAAASPAPGGEEGARTYARTVARYEVPDVTLVDRAGEEVSLPRLLARDGPVVLQFVFTTCPAVCPLLTAQMAALPERLGSEAEGLLRISVSIDPDHDRPERLEAWARRFEAGGADPAGGDWRVLTGDRAAVARVRRAFDAASADKSDHRPLTFLRGGPAAAWVRLEGFPGAGELAAEVRAARRDAEARVDPEPGRRIYEEGILPSGEPLRATAMGETSLFGEAAACGRCHRPSGFGDSEGGLYVPPITGTVLGAPRRPASITRGELLSPLYQEVHTASDRARLRSLAPRPAYDEASLASALRDGRDPAGRPLDPAMPRYALEDADLAHLRRYLARLGATPDPGVDAETVHFATVVTPGVDTAARQAMLAVIEAYVRHRNADVEGFLARPGHSPWHRDELAASLRAWRVHVWELSGPPEGWAAQLRERYRRRPVFALVGGLSGLGAAGEPWQPVHAFCEAERVPCLFPFTDLPGTAPPARWAVYLSEGIRVEARALGLHLAGWAREAPECAGTVRAVQVFRDLEVPRVAAGVFRAAVAGAPAVALEDRVLPGAAPVASLSLGASRARLGGAGICTAWVLWLGEEDLAALPPRHRRLLAAADRVYLSAGLAGVGTGEPADDLTGGWAEELGDRLRMTWPFALPGAAAPREYRVRAWMRSRGVELTHERLQLATHFALAVTDHALRHLVTRYSRRYLLERVEHETERSLDPGLYPHLSLGPDQRIASKGCYVLRPDPESNGGLVPEGCWIVP